MKVEIRPLEINDAYTSVNWRNDKEVFKFTGNTYSHNITLDSELSWIKEVIQRKNEFRCAIITDKKYVGNIYLTNITDISASYHIFIGDKTYWGKGIAKQASKLIIDYGFNQLHLKEIHLKVHVQNKSALK